MKPCLIYRLMSKINVFYAKNTYIYFNLDGFRKEIIGINTALKEIEDGKQYS